MKYSLILFILVMLTVTPVYAQLSDTVLYDQSEYTDDTYEDDTYEEPSYNTVDPSTLHSTKDYSTEKLTVRKFDDKKWKDIIGNTDYDDKTERKKSRPKPGEGTGDSTVNKSKQRAEQQYEEDGDEEPDEIQVGSIPWAGPLLQILFYGVVIAIIIAILFFIIKNTSLRSSRKVPKTELTDVTAPFENIADLDIDMLLQKAAGNYRLAVRLYFLGLLKKLNEGGFIVWKKDKTNRDYLTELYAKAFHYDDVRKLTLAYEQVWYGDHAIPVDVYHQLRDDFKAIDQQLNASLESEKK